MKFYLWLFGIVLYFYSAEAEKKDIKFIKREKPVENFTVPKIVPSESNIFSGLNIRKNAKQRDKELHTLVHPDLLALKNVTFEKATRENFRKGLGPEEAPFPVTARIGPYEVKDPLEGVKNYYW